MTEIKQSRETYTFADAPNLCGLFIFPTPFIATAINNLNTFSPSPVSSSATSSRHPVSAKAAIEWRKGMKRRFEPKLDLTRRWRERRRSRRVNTGEFEGEDKGEGRGGRRRA
jgi:hypothetical protein